MRIEKILVSFILTGIFIFSPATLDLNAKNINFFNSDLKVYAASDEEDITEEDIKEIIKECNEAIRQNPNDYEAYCDRGICYLLQENFDKALTDFNKSIQINSSYADAYYFRGQCYKAMGNNAKAEKDLAKAQSLGYCEDCE